MTEHEITGLLIFAVMPSAAAVILWAMVYFFPRD